LILVGAIGAIVAWLRGIEGDATLLAVSLVAVAIGALEVMLREHLSGYRSHALMLAGLPVIGLHSAVILGVAAFTPAPRALNLGLLVLDVALFAFLFKLLRTRFLDARRERRFAGRR
jgi:hypothetical protein